MSRTSIIGALIVVLVMVLRWKPERRWAAIGLLMGSVACFKVIIPGLIGTITALFASFVTNSDSSTQARTVKYSAIVPYLTERPLFGRGSVPSCPSCSSSPTTSTCSPWRRWASWG